MAELEGGRPLSPLRWLEPARVLRRRAVAMVSLLSRSIAHRELAVVRERLSWSARELEVEQLDASGPGNVLRLELHHASGSSVVTAFGERGVRAEQVADRAVDELGALLAAEVPVDGHLADQLLIPLALAGEGASAPWSPPCTRGPTPGWCSTGYPLTSPSLGWEVAHGRSRSHRSTTHPVLRPIRRDPWHRAGRRRLDHRGHADARRVPALLMRARPRYSHAARHASIAAGSGSASASSIVLGTAHCTRQGMVSRWGRHSRGSPRRRPSITPS